MNLLCRFQRHRWEPAASSNEMTLYSVGGILCGSVKLRDENCKRCGKARQVFRFGSFMNMFQDDTGWRPITPEIRLAIEDGFCKLADIKARQEARRKAKRNC